MKNQYMFFSEQLFDNFDISSFTKVDTCIPNTNIHIYGFEANTEENITVIDQAQKLDDLSQRMAACYTDAFQIISSESSQYFCSQLYPLVVSFETKLRYALYISRALYENGSVTQQSFQYEVEKQKRGRFVLFTLKLNPGKITEIDRAFKIQANLLKYLFVKLEEK